MIQRFLFAIRLWLSPKLILQQSVIALYDANRKLRYENDLLRKQLAPEGIRGKVWNAQIDATGCGCGGAPRSFRVRGFLGSD